MKIFAGTDAIENDEKIIQGMMRFIKGALLYREEFTVDGSRQNIL